MQKNEHGIGLETKVISEENYGPAEETDNVHWQNKLTVYWMRSRSLENLRGFTTVK